MQAAMLVALDLEVLGEPDSGVLLRFKESMQHQPVGLSVAG